MNFEFQNLFGTPVWTTIVDDAEALNKELIQVGGTYQRKTNYFNLPGEGVAKIRRIVHEKADEIAAQYRWAFPISFIKGRQNPISPGGSDSPHHHGTARLVGVYYVNAKPGQGDILLHDPRCGVNWQEPLAKTDPDKRTRAFHRITPVSGMLLLFPGYLIHSVEHNPTTETRLSIAIEVYTKTPTENDYI